MLHVADPIQRDGHHRNIGRANYRLRAPSWVITQVIDVAQNVVSLGQKVADSEMHNIVLVLRQHHGWDADRAVALCRTMVGE